jgi:hypothetical protein
MTKNGIAVGVLGFCLGLVASRAYDLAFPLAGKFANYDATLEMHESQIRDLQRWYTRLDDKLEKIQKPIGKPVDGA